ELQRPLERRGGGALLPSAGERTAHLPGDLALAHDQRVEPGGDLEEVGCGVVATDRSHETSDLVLRRTARGGDRAVGGGGGGRFAAVGVVGLEVELEAVARGEDDGATDGRTVCHDAGAEFRGTGREPVDVGKVQVVVVLGESQEHHKDSIEPFSGGPGTM